MIEIIASILIFLNLFYFVALIKKDFSVIDVAWGLSFLLIFVVSAFTSQHSITLRELVVGSLVLIWSFRLSGYILYRSMKIGKEDYRYAQWRKEWGKRASQIAYKRVFLLQAFLSLVMASPLILIHYYRGETIYGTNLDYFGITLWIIGFLFESIGDFQKHIFKSNPENAGKIMKKGLWKYTRHPNYFGEALLWWGIFLIIINEVPAYYAFIGPLVLTFFLLKVSGVAMLEKKYESNDEYEKYKRETNAFIPWFPKVER